MDSGVCHLGGGAHPWTGEGDPSYSIGNKVLPASGRAPDAAQSGDGPIALLGLKDKPAVAPEGHQIAMPYVLSPSC